MSEENLTFLSGIQWQKQLDTITGNSCKNLFKVTLLWVWHWTRHWQQHLPTNALVGLRLQQPIYAVQQWWGSSVCCWQSPCWSQKRLFCQGKALQEMLLQNVVACLLNFPCPDSIQQRKQSSKSKSPPCISQEAKEQGRGDTGYCSPHALLHSTSCLSCVITP